MNDLCVPQLCDEFLIRDNSGPFNCECDQDLSMTGSRRSRTNELEAGWLEAVDPLALLNENKCSRWLPCGTDRESTTITIP